MPGARSPLLSFVQAEPVGIRWIIVAECSHHAVVSEALAREGRRFTVVWSAPADDVQPYIN